MGIVSGPKIEYFEWWSPESIKQLKSYLKGDKMKTKKKSKSIASQIAFSEGKKSQVSIGNIREVLKVIKVKCRTEDGFLMELMRYLTR